ncbi:hypothetical protein V8E36_000834, partial [Tilletia maclaganii]
AFLRHPAADHHHHHRPLQHRRLITTRIHPQQTTLASVSPPPGSPALLETQATSRLDTSPTNVPPAQSKSQCAAARRLLGSSTRPPSEVTRPVLVQTVKSPPRDLHFRQPSRTLTVRLPFTLRRLPLSPLSLSLSYSLISARSRASLFSRPKLQLRFGPTSLRLPSTPIFETSTNSPTRSGFFASCHTQERSTKPGSKTPLSLLPLLLKPTIFSSHAPGP